MTCTEEYKEHIEYTFHAFCKVVIRNAKYNALRTWRRKYQREISLEYLTEEKFYPFSTTDDYFSGEYPVTVCGDTLILYDRLSALNCNGEDFAGACMRANLRYGKNQKRKDVKSHHYIISFDPRDGADNGLTADRAQELGERFCKEHFPGHQALVCTHADGHNHSGNIHVNIVINSLRIEEVPFLPYMERPADTNAGCKHRCTDAAMRYFKFEVMELCHREGLYQIDLLNGSKNRITDREYWARKKGQLALDEKNAPMIADGITPRQTKFDIDKDRLRQTIRKALTPELVHEFIEKIVVSAPEYKDGKRYQEVAIHYNGVGIIREPTAEEMEEYFQEHISKKPFLKAKTA